MSANRAAVIAVVFGGRSVEHDVSIVTGHQIMRAFDPSRYEVVPLYIDREGRWFTGDPLRDLKSYQGDVARLPGVQEAVFSPNVVHHGLIINPSANGRQARPTFKRLDIVFPAVHGTHGEDGTLQGLFELADVPYVGCGVLASAVANDKAACKAILRDSGIPVVEAITFTRAAWERDPRAIMSTIRDQLAYPVFIKPATLGSSIGIGRAADDALLHASIEVAASLDRRILVEAAVTESVEINCAVMGDSREVTASVLEQPVSWQEFLTYEEKYLRGGEGMKSADRIIPAPLTPELTERVQQLAVAAFHAIDGRGTARIDFLVKPHTGDVYLNEMNTMPGSLAFYLWQEMGMSGTQVVERLVELARDAGMEKRRTVYNYQSNLVALTASRGLKGSKGKLRGR